jgi:hypothetical protein
MLKVVDFQAGNYLQLNVSIHIPILQIVGGRFHNFIAYLHLALSYHVFFVSQLHFCDACYDVLCMRTF